MKTNNRTNEEVRTGFCGTEDCQQLSDCESVGNEDIGTYKANNCINNKCEYPNYRVNKAGETFEKKENFEK